MTSKAVLRAGRDCVARLGQPLASLMLHDAAQLLAWDHGLGEGLRRCVAEGLAETVGASIYTPEQFRAALAIPELTMIQAPFNVLDRRLLEGDLLGRAIASGRVIVLRSLFLQGLLLMDEASVAQKLSFAAPALAQWRALCSGTASPRIAAVAWARQAAAGALFVIGCERPEQVTANVELLTQSRIPADLAGAIAALPGVEERLINPSLWRNP